MLLIHLFALALVLVPAVAFGQDRSFAPLTSIPGLDAAGDSPDITAFLNQLYKICIGAAAGIAVLQIIRAGIYFMTNKGSISENEKARELLQGSVFGLILVLSPVIVFGIINPKILELNFNAERLESRTGLEEPATQGGGETGGDDTGEGPEAPPPVIPGTGEDNPACQTYRNGQQIPASDPTGEQCCAAQSNANVRCSVNWDYSRQPYVKYCGCSFSGTLASPIEYTYYKTFERTCTEGFGCGERETSAPAQVIPRDSARVASYRDSCRAAGGEPDAEDKSWWFEGCPDNSGLSTPAEGTSYKCKTAEYTCN